MESRTHGYARISDKQKQSEARQRKILEEYGIAERDMYVDKVSGKTFQREQYQLMLNVTRPGDLIVTLSIDRFGRNYTEIVEQFRYITQTLKADITVLDMPLLDTRQDCDTLDKRFIVDLILQILSYVAQKERESINVRIRQGIDCMPIVDGKRISSKTGRPTGRPAAVYPANWKEVYNLWQAGDVTAVEAMARLQLKRNTFYKLAKKDPVVLSVET